MVVGVKCLFVWGGVMAQLFATAMELQRNEDSNVLYGLGTPHTKSMTVKN